MKIAIRRIGAAAGLALLLAACASPLSESPKGASELSPASEAQRQVQGLVDLYLAAPAGTSNVVTEYFDGLSVSDDDGNPIQISRLPADKKAAFLDAWSRSRITGLTAKLSDAPEALVSMRDDNDALDEALRSVGGRSAALSDSGAFQERYMEIRRHKSELRQTTGSSAGTSRAASTVPVAANIAEWKSEYRRGRFLIKLGESTSSSSANFGHAAIMTKDAWDPAWDTDGLALGATLSSWPKENSWWPGDTEGVQWEPVAQWASPRGTDKARLYRTVNRESRWSLSKGYYTVDVNASSGSNNESANRAESYYGKAYPKDDWLTQYNFDKFTTSTFYCTSLIWRAWYNTDHKYDLDYGILDNFVTPQNMHDAEDSDQLATWNN